jgi:hypothetical protein
MISFVCDVVDCILRILVIQLTLCFPLPTVFVDLSLGEVFLHPSIAIPWLNHSIDFSKFKISTLSSIITWSLRLFIIQLVITASVLSDNYTTKSTIITPDHSIGQALGHHSIGFLPLSHSIDFKNIPVTTRSITKCGLRNEVNFVSLLQRLGIIQLVSTLLGIIQLVSPLLEIIQLVSMLCLLQLDLR